jgi:hypothetical protein
VPGPLRIAPGLTDPGGEGAEVGDTGGTADPADAASGDPAERGLAGPAEEERRPAGRRRGRANAVAEVPLPGGLLDEGVEQPAAVAEVDASDAVVVLAGARCNAEDEPAAAETVECGGRLRQQRAVRP